MKRGSLKDGRLTVDREVKSTDNTFDSTSRSSDPITIAKRNNITPSANAVTTSSVAMNNFQETNGYSPIGNPSPNISLTTRMRVREKRIRDWMDGLER